MIGSDFDGTSLIMLAARVLTFLLVIPIHESAHGLVAKWLGDDTAYKQGRISLSPFVHIDLYGLLMMIVLGFGWAKPVPVDPSGFKHRRAGYALVSLAGPVSNILAAIVALLIYAGIACTEPGLEAIYDGFSSSHSLLSGIQILLTYLFQVNVGLAVFNMIPLPPLDGFNILRAFMPARFDNWVFMHQRAISTVFMLLLIGMTFIPRAYSPLYVAIDFVYDLLWKAVMWIPVVRWGG